MVRCRACEDSRITTTGEEFRLRLDFAVDMQVDDWLRDCFLSEHNRECQMAAVKIFLIRCTYTCRIKNYGNTAVFAALAAAFFQRSLQDYLSIHATCAIGKGSDTTFPLIQQPFAGFPIYMI